MPGEIFKIVDDKWTYLISETVFGINCSFKKYSISWGNTDPLNGFNVISIGDCFQNILRKSANMFLKEIGFTEKMNI